MSLGITARPYTKGFVCLPFLKTVLQVHIHLSEKKWSQENPGPQDTPALCWMSVLSGALSWWLITLIFEGYVWEGSMCRLPWRAASLWHSHSGRLLVECRLYFPMQIRDLVFAISLIAVLRGGELSSIFSHLTNNCCKNLKKCPFVLETQFKKSEGASLYMPLSWGKKKQKQKQLCNLTGWNVTLLISKALQKLITN